MIVELYSKPVFFHSLYLNYFKNHLSFTIRPEPRFIIFYSIMQFSMISSPHNNCPLMTIVSYTIIVLNIITPHSTVLQSFLHATVCNSNSKFLLSSDSIFLNSGSSIANQFTKYSLYRADLPWLLVSSMNSESMVQVFYRWKPNQFWVDELFDRRGWLGKF